MSHYPAGSQFGMPDEIDMHAPRRTSPLAIVALVLSLLGVIPCVGLITGPIGALLGLVGIATIRPPTKGKGLATVALLIGLACTAVQGYLAYQAFKIGKAAYAAVELGPRDAMTSAFAGDTAAFKNAFYGAGATASDAEATGFISTLRSRYGEFTGAKLDEQAMQGRSTQPQPGQARMDFPYVLTFSNGSANAEVEIIFADTQTGGFINKVGKIHVKDAALGDLVYPASAAPPATQSPAPSSDADPGADEDKDDNPPPTP
jgi:hypothetical protein